MDTEPWYKNAPVGKNKLATLVKEMFLEAGFEENPKTNHSLRAMLFLRLVYRKILYQKQQGTDHLRHCEAMRGHRWTKKKKHVVYLPVLTRMYLKVLKSITHNLLGLLTAKAKFQIFKAVPLVVSSLIIENKKTI